MSRVPVITSPCPLRWNGAPEPGKDYCGHCQRRVHNLDLMSASEREQFLSGCEEKVCVSYTVKRAARLPQALGVSLVAAAALGGSAHADEALVVMPDSAYCDTMEDVILTGGTEAGQKLQWVDESEAKAPEKADLPEISAATWLPTPKD
jgi:hypothetical protein